MTPVEENGTVHDHMTKPESDEKMAENYSIIAQQVKEEVEKLMRSKYGGHPGNSILSLS